MNNDKKEFIKKILVSLSKGLSPKEAKERLVREIGGISSEELFSVEQELINEGISPNEIKRFCNVHAMLFEGMFENKFSDPAQPAHPVNLFKAENREIEKKINAIREAEANKDRKTVKKLLEELSAVEKHYARKEQILFPYLEKRGFYGPSKVMWGKDNEVKELLKKAISNFDETSSDFGEKYLNPFMEELSGMIFKEEKVLFPTALEKLSPAEWAQIFRQSAEQGYIFIPAPKENAELMDLNRHAKKETAFEKGTVEFPTGRINLKELTAILNALPLDITFIDKDDKVKYFSDGRERVFLRSPAVIDREVRNCHPPQSLAAVEKVIDELKKGLKKSHDFWLNLKGRLVYIRYFAVRNEFNEYLGILELTQDITEIQKIKGEKRIV